MKTIKTPDGIYEQDHDGQGWHKCEEMMAEAPPTPPVKPYNDPVNHPKHYTQGGIECIDALKAATVGLTGIEAVCTANAIKYLWRWKRKNGVQDIDKAIWYLERLKSELMEGGAPHD